MSSLLNIKSEILDAVKTLEAAIENEDEISSDLENKISELLTKEADKVDNYCNVLSWLETEANFAREQIKLAQKFVSTKEKAIERLKGRALYVMETFGEKKLLGTAGRSLSIRESTSIVIDEDLDAELLPFDCVRVKVEPDKTVLKEKIKLGQDFKGVKVVTKKNIVWK